MGFDARNYRSRVSEMEGVVYVVPIHPHYWSSGKCAGSNLPHPRVIGQGTLSAVPLMKVDKLTREIKLKDSLGVDNGVSQTFPFELLLWSSLFFKLLSGNLKW